MNRKWSADLNPKKLMERTDLIFVYGTLKRSFENDIARYLRNTQSFIDEGYFPGKLFRISFYPGAVYNPQSSSLVYGDVFQIVHQPKKLFELLDEYEGIGDNAPEPPDFERRVIPISVNGQTRKAYCYLFAKDHSQYPLIPSGVFSSSD